MSIVEINGVLIKIRVSLTWMDFELLNDDISKWDIRRLPRLQRILGT